MGLEFWFGAFETSLRFRGVKRKSVPISNDRRLAYFEAGPPDAAKTVLLVHGLGSSAVTWMHVIGPLAQTYRVVAVDLPGYGKSTLPPGRDHQTFPELVEALIEFIGDDGIFPTPPAVLGQSLGGWLTIRVTRLRPDLVERLILVNSAGILFPGIEKLRTIIDTRSRKEVDAFWERLYYRVPPMYSWFWRSAVARMHKPQVIKFIDSLGEEDFINDDLPRLEVPVSIIWGRADRYVPISTVDLILRETGSAHVYWMAKCGHVPQLEQPQDFTRAVQGILRMDPEDLPLPPRESAAAAA